MPNTLPIESPGGAGLLTRRPAPVVLQTLDIASLIYGFASHKLANGNAIIFRPDGTQVQVLSTDNVSAEANWFDTSGFYLPTLSVRLAGFTSGSWSIGIMTEYTSGLRKAGGYASFQNSGVNANSTQTNQGLYTSISVSTKLQSPNRIGLILIANSDLIVPATGARAEVSIISFPRQ